MFNNLLKYIFFKIGKYIDKIQSILDFECNLFYCLFYNNSMYKF